MGTEPERPIENLLRAAAHKRREEAGPPLEVHPATRRLWQGEVARQYVAKGARRQALGVGGASAEEPGWSGGFWLKFAVGIAVVAIAGLLAALWTLHPNKNEAVVAKNDLGTAPLPAKMPREEMESAPRPAPAYLPKEPPGQLAATMGPAVVPEKPDVQAEAGRIAIASVDRLVGEPPKTKAQPGPAALDLPQPPSNIAKNEVAASGGTISQPATPAPDAFARRYGLNASAAALPAPPAAPPVSGGLSFNRTEPAATAVFSNQAAQNYAGQESTLKSLNAPSLAKASPSAGPKDVPKLAAVVSNQPQNTALGQQFIRLESNPKAALSDNAGAGKPILDSFQVEQSSDEFRIIDSDGSVYSGSLQGSVAPGRAPATGAAGAVRSLGVARAPAPQAERIRTDATKAAQQAVQSYFFRVTGVNNSLNQNVIFTGKLDGWPAGTGRVQTTVSQPQSTAELRNVRLSGTAVVGTNKPIRIEAVPTAEGK
jgi:hypothetical protein